MLTGGFLIVHYVKKMMNLQHDGDSSNAVLRGGAALHTAQQGGQHKFYL